MTMSDRDRKIVLVLVPLLLVGAFVFFVIKPKREEASKAARDLAAQQDRRDRALATEQQLLTAKRSFAADYTTVVRLGKAVPTDVDMPSVLVQLERAAVGTKIDFGKIAAGPRVPAAGESSSGGGAAGAGGAGGSSSAQPVAAGGEKAQSGAGQATEKANNAAAGSEQSTANRENAMPESGSSGSSGGSAGSPGAQAVAGLDTVPLELRFTGSFFDLADFFHSLKRFVRVANQQLLVRGRLMTIDAFTFKSESFPKIEAEMKARIFLAPEQEGATAGASPQGPSSGGAPKATPASSEPATGTPTAAAPGVAGP
jgi:Tfp pilus assembly protein PilO